MVDKSTRRSRTKSVTIGITVVAAIGVAFVIGAFAVGPRLTKSAGGYIPTAVLNMPVGLLPVTDQSGNSITLQVRIAETPEARKAGLASVGIKALDATILLYAQPKATSSRVTYTMSGIRAPLELAVIGELGNIVAIKKVEANAKSIVVTEKHRYMIAAKEVVLGQLGITKGSTISTGNIKRIS